MGLTSPSQVADFKKPGSFFNWNSSGSQGLGPIPVEEEDTSTGRCSGVGWIQSETGVSLWMMKPPCICQTGNLGRQEAEEGGRLSCPP